ncbi:PAS and ANTAR domain-containing protein [Rhodococcoides trifolii]|nr:PAS and ANTAR domain-containing protein [Rhodococcus trifolii]
MTIGPLATPRVGRYRYTVGTGELNWSDDLYEIYGYKPGELALTLEAVVEHCHPDERQRAQEVVANTIETGDRCLYAHRIVTKNGTLRDVVILGDAEYDADGAFVDVAGYVLDVTEHTDRVVTNRLGQELDGIVDARAVIEQAKGILMLAFGIDADKAFAVLAWQSQTKNVKLRHLACRIIADVTDNASLAAPIKESFEDLLLSAHSRIDQA